MWRLLYCLWPLTSSAWGHRICTSQRANTCVVESNTTTPTKTPFKFSGNIEFKGAVWQCNQRLSSSWETMKIEIIATGKVSLLEGSLLHCATVTVQAQTVVISDTSEISANGTSHAQEANLEGEKWGSAAQRGASHGGLGGTASGCTDDAQLTRRLALVHGDPFAPWQFGRAGGSPKRGAGGGRVKIVATTIQLNGTLSASGTAPDDADEEGGACGSGGGRRGVVVGEMVGPTLGIFSTS
eukprot:s3554_g1.t1